MSVDVFLLINLLALFHRTTALPARIPSPGRAPRPSCVIPKPRLPKPHSCFLTDPDSICLPTSVLTVPLGLLYSAVVPKGAFSIRDQHKPPKPLVSILGSNWRGAQARWFNVHMDNSGIQLCSDWDCSTRPDLLRRCPQGCFFHPRPTSTSKPSGLHPWFQLAPCSSSLAQYQSSG